MVEWLNRLPWSLVLIACLTLGLAPFAPPHIWEKLQMLGRGELKRAIDWFDLAFHGAPWLVALAKIVVTWAWPRSG